MRAPLLWVLQMKWTQVHSKCSGSMCTRYMITRSAAVLYGRWLDLGTVHLHNPTFASIAAFCTHTTCRGGAPAKAVNREQPCRRLTAPRSSCQPPLKGRQAPSHLHLRTRAQPLTPVCTSAAQSQQHAAVQHLTWRPFMHSQECPSGLVQYAMWCGAAVWQAPQWFGPSITTAQQSSCVLGKRARAYGAWVTTQPARGMHVTPGHCLQGQQHAWVCSSSHSQDHTHTHATSPAGPLQSACLVADTPTTPR